MLERGNLIHGFEVKRVREIAAIEAHLIEMEHVKSGAKLVFIDRNDANKSFGISFKTLPDDDTGGYLQSK